MNRSDYMKELARRLAKLPKEEYDRAMEYFEEYFEEAGTENEADAIASLGTPQEAAEEILKEIALRLLEENREGGKKGARKRLSTFWIVLLSIGAFPVTLIGLVILMIALVVVGFIFLIIAFFLFAYVAFALSEVAAGAWLLTFSPASGLLTLGSGIFIVGAGCYCCRPFLSYSKCWKWPQTTL